MALVRDVNHPGALKHPGEILREKFIVPLCISSGQLAAALCVSSTRVREIVAERRSITADTAYRLAFYFAISPMYWMDMQRSYELALLYKYSQSVIKNEVQPRLGSRA